MAVSSSVSPFAAKLRLLGARLTTSAPRRSSARLNDANVRVLSSKKMFAQALPASSGPGGDASNCAVRSKTSASSSAVRSSRSMRLRRIRTRVSHDRNLISGRRLGGQRYLDAFVGRRRYRPADVIGLDRQLAQSAVDQHA